MPAVRQLGARRRRILRLAGLLTFGGGVALLQLAGLFRGADDLACGPLFRLRGPLPIERPIVYVARGSEATVRFGGEQIPRSAYAQAAAAVLGPGGAEAVFFDYVFSPLGLSPLADFNRVVRDEAALASVVRAHPGRIVLGASYSNVELPFMDAPSYLPLVNRPHLLPNGERVPYDPKTNPYPETPTFPFWSPPFARDGLVNMGWGRVGLLNLMPADNRFARVRRLPLFVETHSDEHARNYLAGQARWIALTEPGTSLSLDESEDKLALRDGAGTIRAEVPVPLEQTFYSAGLELYCARRGLDSRLAIEHSAEAMTVSDYVEQRELVRLPLEEGQLALLNWSHGWGHAPIVSLMRVLDRAAAAHSGDTTAQAWFEETFAGAAVLFGSADPLLQDMGPTPFDRDHVPRVLVHGNLLAMLEANRPLRASGPGAAAVLSGLTVCVIGLPFVLRFRRARLPFLVALALLLGYLTLAVLLFSRDLLLPVSAPLAGGGVVLALSTLLSLREASSRRRHLQRVFGTYVSGEVVRQLADSGSPVTLAGEEREVTAFVLDLAGFTELSRALAPAQLVAGLNHLFDTAGEVVLRYDGAIDKYVGDALLAVFGAPLEDAAHRAAALAAARELLALQERLRSPDDQLARHWGAWAGRLRWRVALASGPALVGNVGSSRRMNYTAMGDTVNVCARLEELAGLLGAPALCSGPTLSGIESTGTRHLGDFSLRGRDEPLAVHEVFPLPLARETIAANQAYAQGLELLPTDARAAAERFDMAARLEGVAAHWPGRRTPADALATYAREVGTSTVIDAGRLARLIEK